jgi:hypothetical protein
MKAATYGTFALLISLVAAFFLKWLTPDFKMATWLSIQIDVSKEAKENRLASWLILLSFSTVATAYLWTCWSKIRTAAAIWALSKVSKPPEDKEFYRQVLRLTALSELLSDGSLGQLFFNSATTDTPVLVTLKSRKVYVGTVKMISEPNEKQGPYSEISINPIMSGYREKDSLRVLFSNDYNNLGDIDTSVIFPVSEVSHASWFDMKIHEEVDNNHEKNGLGHDGATQIPIS